MKNIARLKAEIETMPGKEAYDFAKKKSLNKKGERDLQLFGELCLANIEARLREKNKPRLPYKD